jgi:hypothetical protein
MVTGDSKRDYYADLGLPAHANPDEIKKKYKNLGIESNIVTLRAKK